MHYVCTILLVCGLFMGQAFADNRYTTIFGTECVDDGQFLCCGSSCVTVGSPEYYEQIDYLFENSRVQAFPPDVETLERVYKQLVANKEKREAALTEGVVPDNDGAMSVPGSSGGVAIDLSEIRALLERCRNLLSEAQADVQKKPQDIYGSIFDIIDNDKITKEILQVTVETANRRYVMYETSIELNRDIDRMIERLTD